jgi:hypothetical protein
MYRNFVLVALALSMLASTPLAWAKKAKPKKDEHLVTTLANEYLRAFVTDEEDDDDDDDTKTEVKPKADIITFSVGKHQTVDVPLMTELSPVDRYKVAFGILDVHIRQGKIQVHKTIDPTFLKTMEIVYGGKEGKDSLIRDLNYSTSIIPETALAWALAQPCPDASLVKHNQAIIKELVSNHGLYYQLDAKLKKLAQFEESLLSFYTPADSAFFEALKQARFYSPWGKTSPKVMSILTIVNLADKCKGLVATGQLGGIGTILLLGGILAKDPGIVLGGTVLTALAGLLAYITYAEVKNFTRMMCQVQQRMISLASYINTLNEIHQLINSNQVLKHHFIHNRYLNRLFEGRSSDKTNRLLSLLSYNTFKGEPSFWFSYNGRTLATYALVQETKYELCDAIMAGGQLGALMSAAQLYIRHQDTKVKYSFVEFIDNDRPYIQATNAWNPRLDAAKAVPSSFELGGLSAYNMILTGGNGLGKSTIMKGLIYGLVEAQVFGIAPAERLVMTPFARMMCHTNVTDNIAAGLSGFTAELAMKDMILKEYSLLKPTEFVITVFDELFKSTNPDDAATLSKQLCRTLAGYRNNMSIIATHLAPVTELEAEGTHANYHPGFITQGNGLPAKPTYTLEKGASFDHNAIALYNQQKN